MKCFFMHVLDGHTDNECSFYLLYSKKDATSKYVNIAFENVS